MSKYKNKTSPKNNNNLFLILAIAAAFIVGLAVVLTNGGQPETTGRLPLDVTIDQAAELREEGVFVLDVRTPEEWDQVHIPGAVLIPLNELPARLDEIPQDSEVLVYCRSGNRSQTGRDILLDAGFDQVTSMLGGIIQWQAAGNPVEYGP